MCVDNVFEKKKNLPLLLCCENLWCFSVTWCGAPNTNTNYDFFQIKARPPKLAWFTGPLNKRHSSLQLTFLYLKMNQDIFFYVLWLKYTLNIYISCCVVVWCVTKQCYEHSWEALFVFWDDLIFVNSSRQQKWTNYN